MKRIFFVLILYISGCGVFNPGDKYNPDYTPKPTVEPCHKDSIRVDTIRLTNGVDHIIMLDTVKVKWEQFYPYYYFYHLR